MHKSTSLSSMMQGSLGAIKRKEVQRVKKQEQSFAEDEERIKAALEADTLDRAYMSLPVDMQDVVRQKAMSNLPHALIDNSLAVKMGIREVMKKADFTEAV